MIGAGCVRQIRLLWMIFLSMEQVFIHSKTLTYSLSIQIGVLAIHLHYLRINKPFIQLKDIHQHDVSIDTFRLCISVYALSRYSKTIRVYPTESNARFDQTMQMLIRVNRREFLW